MVETVTRLRTRKNVVSQVMMHATESRSDDAWPDAVSIRQLIPCESVLPYHSWLLK